MSIPAATSLRRLAGELLVPRLGSCEAGCVASPPKLWFVFCAALAVTSGSCVGGPTSDYPSHADDDDKDDDSTEGPPSQMDAGTGAALDAAAVRDASSPNASEGGDASDAGDAGDRGVAGDGAADGGLSNDSGSPLDGGG
jgi:hypothetical protein